MVKSISSQAPGQSPQTLTTPLKRQSLGQDLDRESVAGLSQMAGFEQVDCYRVSDAKTVLIVLSSKGMAFDYESLRQKIHSTYPGSSVFFQTSMAMPVGKVCPKKVDLVIDFIGPGELAHWGIARRLRRMGRVVVGRNSGWFGIRRRIYNRIYDELHPEPLLPREMLERERFVQKKVLNLAGVAVVQASDTPADRGKVIARELPSLQRTHF